MNPSRSTILAALVTLLCASSTLAAASAQAAGQGALARAHETSVEACAGAGEAPDAANIETVRAAILCLVNRERTSRGESALTVNRHLEASAQGHTESMANGDYFEHYGPGGQSPVSRARAAGYITSSRTGWLIGENIAFGTLWLATPRAIVAAWMASPGHRANILNGRFRETGIGVSDHPPVSLSGGQAGGIYTQDFGSVITG
jgi:uncharacterized protein YkwD